MRWLVTKWMYWGRDNAISFPSGHPGRGCFPVSSVVGEAESQLSVDAIQAKTGP